MTVPAGRVLAVDLGDARIGLALSDPLGLTAQPLDVLPSEGRARDAARVAGLAREHDAAVVVVGYPRLMSGEAGERAKKAEAFVGALSRLTDAEVSLWDERLTTVEAQRTLIAADVRRARRRQVVDAVAAALILQGWLDAQRSSST